VARVEFPEMIDIATQSEDTTIGHSEQ
jgi:hypothetical protein